MKVRVSLTGLLQQAGCISDSYDLVHTIYDLVLSAEFLTLIDDGVLEKSEHRRHFFPSCV